MIDGSYLKNKTRKQYAGTDLNSPLECDSFARGKIRPDDRTQNEFIRVCQLVNWLSWS